ncbi:hypothetical protein CC86DRAFT_303593 [Ophiobolus disseminans]|uniref:Atos-like conserved domain-containing protein n=1 Tax=Ophiobolus disseminans TaxID=1469910 RepID=A0A6A6ZJQ9_9PLEO|nr:hypothetical protein CC86DRAFT_303593 [Ophiobolus disseminans]
MPIFHDPPDSPPRRPSSRQMSSTGQRPRTELNLSLLHSMSPGECTELDAHDQTGSLAPYLERKPFDRADLIERLKRTKSPTWGNRRNDRHGHDRSNEPSPISRDRPKTPLLHSSETKPTRTSTPDPPRDFATLGLEIERPRSALHSGDFREKKEDGSSASGSSTAPFLATSPVVPWNRSFPAAAYPSQRNEAAYSFDKVFGQDTRAVSRARAISQSSTSSFAFLPPTSPLVHQANNTDLDFSSRPGSRQTSRTSPLQHAPMVGSYEESILRGRMSTTPSRPLDFVAKIGVLGRGECKSSLECPPHVTVPFPAVFYSYNTGNGRISDNEPSPYVGLIDLENSLPTPKEATENGHRKRRHAVPAPDHDDLDFRISSLHESAGQNAPNEARKKEKRKRISTSPKAPPGGSYRIPPQGQLQIVLKNPNNTAVKLFLVPYDLSDMAPGQKTFIRQRSYSAGPIIDMPTSSRNNLGTDRPEAALSNSEDPNDRPILRYLIHLNICCPSRGRYFLYKSIRVVFANRVPDGKEKLRNEIQQPEPRYSTYKPSRDIVASQYGSPAVPQLTSDKAFRRRSAGWPLSRSQQAYDQLDGLSQRPPIPPPAVKFTGGTLNSSASSGFSSPMTGLDPIPFNLTRLAAIESRPVSRDRMDVDIKVPFRTPGASPKSGLVSPIGSQGAFEKLTKGDVGYGGNAFSPLGSPTSPPSAGLLSQRLRGLEVRRNEEPDE